MKQQTNLEKSNSPAPCNRHVSECYGESSSLTLTNYTLLLGWLLTSLGFLGSPASFAAHVSEGLRSLVHSIVRGGRGQGLAARVRGVGMGTRVLAQHMAGGTLGSLVSIAKSLGRNAERLSFDAEHTTLRSEARRRPAAGAGTGFVQGLQGTFLGRGGSKGEEGWN